MTLDLTIERPVAGGRMLARHDGRVVLVSGTIPGERVRVRVERVVRQVTWAETIEVLEASADRRDPVCDHACGGSSYAHIAYARQLAIKREVIADALHRIAKHDGAPSDVAASPEQGYRLRARLHVRNGQAGFFREGTHVLCDARATGQLSTASLDALDALVRALGSHSADVDAIILAENVAGTERVFHLEPRAAATLEALAGRHDLSPGITGLTTIARGRPIVIAGTPAITDTAAQLFGVDAPIDASVTWSRRATSFFQGNRFLIGALVRRVLDLTDSDRFVDLYAGVGLFSIALAARGASGVSVEGDWSGATDLRINASPWPSTLHVVRESVEHAVTQPLDPPPGVVILDPPRTGMSPEALSGALAWRSPKLVYVSCDPPTFARDTARILAAGYQLTSLDAFDLFPNTPHVEVVGAFVNSE
jgi:23S rRNA (uracil1939-C5)-methyltransferase